LSTKPTEGQNELSIIPQPEGQLPWGNIFALRDLYKPMGVSEFQFIETLPENLKSRLPTIDEIERELIKQ